MKATIVALLAWSVSGLSTASAAPVMVTSYSMLNGAMGAFNYRDFTYLPCGSCSVTAAALSGGTGKLTDGVSPTLDWYQQGQNTTWVGWDKTQGLLNPVVTFNFGSTPTIDAVTVWVSNSLSGGVSLPSSVVIGGTSFSVAPDTLNTAPRALTFSGLSFTGNNLTVEFDQASQWVIVGEVSFDGTASTTATPEPVTFLLAGGALLAALVIKRKTVAH